MYMLMVELQRWFSWLLRIKRWTTSSCECFTSSSATCSLCDLVAHVNAGGQEQSGAAVVGACPGLEASSDSVNGRNAGRRGAASSRMSDRQRRDHNPEIVWDWQEASGWDTDPSGLRCREHENLAFMQSRWRTAATMIRCARCPSSTRSLREPRIHLEMEVAPSLIDGTRVLTITLGLQAVFFFRCVSFSVDTWRGR